MAWRDFVFDYGDSQEYMERVRTSALAPLIITCALNGGVQGKELNDALPETPEEIAAQAREAYDAGATVVHIHGRDPDNLPMSAEDPEVYLEINARVREACPDIVVNNTSLRELGIKPEMETYQPGHFWVSNDLRAAGLLDPPYLHQFVLGYQTSSFPTARDLAHLVSELPDDAVFFVCGVGQFQLPMTTMSILMGGHVRVGLEDNVYYSRGRKLRGNGEAVERTVRIARELNRDIATAAATRGLLGLGEPRAYDRTAAGTIAG